MFTGLIQAVGKVVERGSSSLRIEVGGRDPQEPFAIGESVAVNGCCLTVVSAGDALAFDLSEETRRRTNLGELQPGEGVNLERALRAADRMGGHFVQGHVDGIGELIGRIPSEIGEVLRFRAPDAGSRYLIDKGSIALDGISLTVIEPRGAEFDVAIVPHTLAATTLRDLAPGRRVNVEFDMLAKYVERLLGRPDQ